MNDDNRPKDAGHLERVSRLPSLRDFSLPLAALVEPDAPDLNESFDRLGQRVGAAPEPLTVQFEVSDARSWYLDVGPTGCTVSEQAHGSPDVEVILDSDAWRRIASGNMSPLEAFGRGQLRVRGDIAVARRFARLLPHTDAGDLPGPQES
jgi:hypothetical protein